MRRNISIAVRHCSSPQIGRGLTRWQRTLALPSGRTLCPFLSTRTLLVLNTPRRCIVSRSHTGVTDGAGGPFKDSAEERFAPPSRMSLDAPRPTSLEGEIEEKAPLLSYRHRLERFHFTSLTDLMHAPYAPSIFTVIKDVVHHIRALESNPLVCSVDDERGAAEASTTANEEEPVKQMVHRRLRSPSVPSISSSLSLCRSALSSPREVHHLVKQAVRYAAETVQIAKEMGGDPMSHQSLREVTREISSFMDFVKDVCNNDSTTRATSTMVSSDTLLAPWTFQTSVKVVLYRAVLEIASTLGLHVLAVDALHALTEIEEQVAVQHAKEARATSLHSMTAALEEENQSPGGALTGSSTSSSVTPPHHEAEEEFSLDDILEVVKHDARHAEQQNALVFMGSPTALESSNCMSSECQGSVGMITTSRDYVMAIQSCAAGREFELGLALYHRLLEHIQKEKRRLRVCEGVSQTGCKDSAREQGIGIGIEEGNSKDRHSMPGVTSLLHPSSTPTRMSAFAGSQENSFGLTEESAANTASEFVLLVEQSLIALANACRHHEDFEELRRLLVESEVAAAMPVSVSFYTSMITAVSRSAESAAKVARQSRSRSSNSSMEMLSAGSTSSSEKALKIAEVNAIYQQHLSVAFSFYRQLRDVGLLPTAETYASLIGCCAVCQEPTQAFALYHEARVVCSAQPDSGGDGATLFSPSLYTNLLLAYHYGGYAADAKKTLEVLVEAGAPLERASFHAVLASCVSLREGKEVLDMMVRQYHIPPTPHTYAFLLQAVVRRSPMGNKPASSSSSFGGVDAVLHLYDLHEAAMQALSEQVGSEAASRETPSNQGSVPAGEADKDLDLDEVLMQRYGPYVTSLTQALLHLRIDPEMDPRLKRYLKPLVRVVQLGMNRYTGCSPQCPTHVPPPPSAQTDAPSSMTAAGVHKTSGVPLCVAVLSADVLANLEEFVVPFLSHYSLLVIPFCALVALQQGGAYRMDNSPHGGYESDLNGFTSGDAIQEVRRRKLQRFIRNYAPIIHLMSCEDEIRWSRDVHRYGIPRRDWIASAAAITLNLARTDVAGGTKLYAASAQKPFTDSPILVLVSSNYKRCGKYLLDFKRGVQLLARRARSSRVKRDVIPSAAVQAAVAHVFYHNPYTTPHWKPPTISAAAVAGELEGNPKGDMETSRSAAQPTPRENENTRMPSPSPQPTVPLEELKRRIISRREGQANKNTAPHAPFDVTSKDTDVTRNQSVMGVTATATSGESEKRTFCAKQRYVPFPFTTPSTPKTSAPSSPPERREEDFDFSAALLQSIIEEDADR